MNNPFNREILKYHRIAKNYDGNKVMWSTLLLTLLCIIFGYQTN